MAIHNNVNKAHLRRYYIVRLKSIKKYISTGFCSMCASQMHTYYHLEFQQSPTSILIIKNLQDEVCNTAYWICKSQKHTGKPSSAATELQPPTLPRLDLLPATGDISKRGVYCQKQTNMNPLNGEVAYGCAMPVLRSHNCS